ncbi:stress responsive A/B barrel domain-containing protein [Xylariaceae sp. FL0016]|nr:stress responsive A/B barrel domain-containing protein [Xylariaceae sp. FL0016]
MARIRRVTMFKVPDAENQNKVLDAYKSLEQNQKKDGKPYILSMSTGRAMEDQRSHGWTVVNESDFATLDDMRYYDNQCEAHAALKARARSFGIEGGPQGIMTVYFETARH